MHLCTIQENYVYLVQETNITILYTVYLVNTQCTIWLLYLHTCYWSVYHCGQVQILPYKIKLIPNYKFLCSTHMCEDLIVGKVVQI